MANKKIIGATNKSFNGINFKSQLEVMIYKTLLQEGFDPQYENNKFTIWEGFKPTVKFYNRDVKTKLLKLEDGKLRDITYTPDFVFIYNNVTIIIEAKGFENDVFPVKKKLFRKLLESYNKDSVMFFEIYTKKQLIEAINIIKNVCCS